MRFQLRRGHNLRRIGKGRTHLPTYSSLIGGGGHACGRPHSTLGHHSEYQKFRTSEPLGGTVRKPSVAFC
jgi:hypothetical protein